MHFPIWPGRDFAKKSPNGIYSDWVEEVDWSVGKVLDTVRELGLEKNTLVIFTSDNGGTARGVNAPLRGFKGSTWEGGMREPTVAWWPGTVAAGTATMEITSMMDILPTFAALAGGKLPTAKIDGGDISPILLGKAGAQSPHADLFYYFRGLKLEAVRSGPWKLQIAGGDPKKGKQKAKPDNSFPHLYNLADDIGETTDVAAAHADVVAKLQALAEKMKDDLGMDGVGPGCREMGRVANPEPLIHHDGTIRAGFEP